MLDYQASIIIALAFSLSSTAVVLSHLKASKEIYTPYGQKATGILIFQDIAVIPIILLIGFFATDEGNVQDIIIHTTLSAVVLVGILLIVGKRVMTYLLHFSASSDVDELFMGSILLLVMGASFMAHEAGFTYSLGAFIVGMLIAETKYHAKVESDISPFKDVLLGTFFITVGMKIDLAYLFSHTLLIISLLVAIILVKSIIIFMIIRFRNNSATALKSALSLAQVGEFSFAVFALAASSHLMEHDLIGLLILIIAGSMIITPFIISNVNSISTKIFHKEEVANDFSNVAKHHNYAIVCGYSIVGKMVAKRLKEQGLEYIIIDNSLKHVKEGLAANEEIFFGDLSRQSIAKSLHIENSASVIITLDNPEKRALICDAVLKTFPRANIVVKINSDEEREKLAHFDLRAVVDGKREVANILVEQTVSCKL